MSNQNKVSDATEPYGAQVLRRLHEDQSLLMADYDAMNENLDPNDPQQAGVKALLTKKLVTMEKSLSSIEKSFNTKYKELEPIEDSLPVEENKEETNVDEPIIVEHVELGPCVVVDASEDGSAIIVEDEQGQQHEVELTAYETKSLFGRKKSWRGMATGAGLGAMVGGVPGAAIGAYMGTDGKKKSETIQKSMRRGAMIGAGMGLAVAGAAVGAGIGHLLEQRARRREAQAQVALGSEQKAWRGATGGAIIGGIMGSVPGAYAGGVIGNQMENAGTYIRKRGMDMVGDEVRSRLFKPTEQKGIGQAAWDGAVTGGTAGGMYGTAVGGVTGGAVGALGAGVGAIPGAIAGAGTGATVGAGVGALGGAAYGAARHLMGNGKKEKGWHKDSDSFCPDCQSEPCACEGPGEYGEKRNPTYMSPLFSMGDLNVTAGNAGVVGTGMQVPKMDFGLGGGEEETKKYLARKRYKNILIQTSKFLSDISQAKDLEEEDRMKCYHMHAILTKGMLKRGMHVAGVGTGAAVGAGAGSAVGGMTGAGIGGGIGAVAGGIGGAMVGGSQGAGIGAGAGAALGTALGGGAGTIAGGAAGGIGGAKVGDYITKPDDEDKKGYYYGLGKGYDPNGPNEPGVGPPEKIEGGIGSAIGGTAGEWIGGRLGSAAGAIADNAIIPLIFRTSKFLKSLAFEKAFGLPHRETAKALQEEVDQEIEQVEQEENQEEQTEQEQMENGEEGQEQYIPEEYNTPEGFDDEANPPDSMNEYESGIYEPSPEEAVEGTFGEYGEEMGERGEKGVGNALHGLLIKPSEDIGAGVYDVVTGNVERGSAKIGRGATYGPYVDAYQGATNTGYYSPGNRQNQESNLHGASTLGAGVTGSVIGGTLGSVAGAAGGPIGVGIGGYAGSALGGMAGAGIGHVMTRKKPTEKSLFGVYTRVKSQGWVLAKSFQSPRVAMSYAKHLNAMGKAVHVDRVRVKGYGRSIATGAIAGGLAGAGLGGAAGASYGSREHQARAEEHNRQLDLGTNAYRRNNSYVDESQEAAKGTRGGGVVGSVIGGTLGAVAGGTAGAIRQYRQNRAQQKAMTSMGDDGAYKTDAMGFRVHRDQVDAKTKIGRVLQGVKEVIQAVGGSAEVRAHGLDIKFRISWDVIGDVMGKLVAMFGKAVSRSENEITVNAGQVEDSPAPAKKRNNPKRDPYASEDGPDFGENPSRKGKNLQDDPGFVGDLNWIKEEQQELEHGGPNIQDVLQSQGQQIEELSKALMALHSQLS